MENSLPGPEQEAEEILVLEGFADPEDLEPEIAELLRERKRLLIEAFHRLMWMGDPGEE